MFKYMSFINVTTFCSTFTLTIFRIVNYTDNNMKFIICHVFKYICNLHIFNDEGAIYCI